jgi:hypothetical protein
MTYFNPTEIPSTLEAMSLVWCKLSRVPTEIISGVTLFRESQMTPTFFTLVVRACDNGRENNHHQNSKTQQKPQHIEHNIYHVYPPIYIISHFIPKSQ